MERQENVDRAPAQHAERRTQARHLVDTSAVIYLIDLAAVVHGRILDVSLGGCRIRADQRFPVGIFRRVETEFRIEGLPFRLAGVTQALYDRCTVGIRFLNISERKKEQLIQLIEEIEELREREKPSVPPESSHLRLAGNEPSPSGS